MTPKAERLTDAVTLYEGRCEDVLPTLPAVDVVITDPPYEITAAGGGIGRSRRDLQETEGFTDCGFDYSILAPFDNWMCFGTLRQVPRLIEAAGDRRWMLITWNKPNPCPLVNGNYLPDTEYIVHAWRRGGLSGGVADKARFIVHRLGDKEHGQHPNEKPLTVMRKLIRTGSKPGAVILDPFAGSGTTAKAAMMEGRKCILIEQDPHYCEIIRRRVREADGAAPGTLFREVARRESLFADEPEPEVAR